MKILMLVPFLPNIQTSGGQTRWYNIIKYLSQIHDITLFSLIKDEKEKEFIPELEKYCKKVRVFRRPKSPWTFRNMLLTAFTWYPLLVIRNYSQAEKKAIEEELKSGDYDLIHAETFYVMPHVPTTNVPSILVEQTIEYQVYMHYVINDAPLYIRPLMMLDVLKLKYWEKHFWKKADQLVAVSSEDKKVMQRLIPGVEVDIIPNGVDAKHYAKRKIRRKVPPRLFYGVTNFEWLQNVEAVEILLDKVLPEVRKEIPNAHLWVAGRKIPDSLIKRANVDKYFETTESIPDARDAYSQAAVMVTPIKGSGGTRLKILEAMAAGLPVVSTSVGVAGLNLVDGIHAVVRDDISDLAHASVELLKDPVLSKKIGEQGRKFVKNYYDWEAIVKLHEKIYKKAYGKKNL
ncbi:glycosyltransferase [Candidatus Woesebacteria bacterium]|nr:MAG: glycosyltransferase [Candidatus Woesebacteria bacterium]